MTRKSWKFPQMDKLGQEKLLAVMSMAVCRLELRMARRRGQDGEQRKEFGISRSPLVLATKTSHFPISTAHPIPYHLSLDLYLPYRG